MNVQEKSIFLNSVRNVDICCKLIITSRQYSFFLELLEQSKNNDIYLWGKSQVEISSFEFFLHILP
jgi:hypothetical protein